MTGPLSPTLARVVRGHLCSGCGLCASLSQGAVTMVVNPRGYNRPSQNRPLDQKTEDAIAATCPGAVVAAWPQAPNADPLWGPWRRVMTGHATDASLRHHASSGGALSALVIHALRSGLVDRAIHIAADPANPTGAIATRSTTEAEVWQGAGSRYTASSPLAAIDQALGDGGAFAIVGKPCDISALRRLAMIDPRVDRHARLMLSFFCAGIPGRLGVDEILSGMGVEREELAAFRYRGDGWPGSAVATLRDGHAVSMGYEESWGQHLSRDIQFRCKICPDAVGGVADIACADAWYGDARGYPSFDERDGRSLIIARTPAGDQLLDAAIAAGAVEVSPLDVAEIEHMQPSQVFRKRLIRARVAALAVTLQPRPRMQGTQVQEAARAASVIDTLRNFLGSIRRIVLGRR